jgi:ATP-dependent Clp protease protease subunit
MVISNTASASVFESNHPMVVENRVAEPRVVYVQGGISQSMAKSFKRDMRNAQATGQTIIPIVISSYGGSVYSLLEMVDEITKAKAKGFKIATICTGKAMSAGAVLLTFGDEGLRFAGKNATIMIHDVAGGVGGKIGEIKATAAEGDRLNNLIFEMMSVNIGKGKSYLSDIVHKKGHVDWFLTSEQALNHGIINKISIPDLKVEIKVRLLLE